jgi:heat shock protein HslJ
MKIFPKKLVHLLIGTLFLPLAACAAINDGIQMPGGNGSETSLANTRWKLISYGQPGSETPVIEGTGVTLQFEGDSQAGGSGGCNTFGAQYEVSDGNQLSIVDIISTLMACSDEGLMDQETEFFDALRTAESFEFAGEGLTIRYEGGLLKFSRVTSSAPSTVNI